MISLSKKFTSIFFLAAFVMGLGASEASADTFKCWAKNLRGKEWWGRSGNIEEAKGLALGDCQGHSKECHITHCKHFY